MRSYKIIFCYSKLVIELGLYTMFFLIISDTDIKFNYVDSICVLSNTNDLPYTRFLGNIRVLHDMLKCQIQITIICSAWLPCPQNLTAVLLF
jgi:hypothetical protein